MRYVDLLKTTVLLSAASATVLAVITVVQSNAIDDSLLVLIAAGWWVVAALIGAWLGRRLEASPSVARALRDAQSTTMLPEQNIGRMLLSRLWPLLLAALVSAIFSFFLPQVAAIATGFMVIWSLSWRHQDRAVTAIEERDGVTFFVTSGSPIKPIKLVRTPGLRRDNGPEQWQAR